MVSGRPAPLRPDLVGQNLVSLFAHRSPNNVAMNFPFRFEKPIFENVGLNMSYVLFVIDFYNVIFKHLVRDIVLT